MFASDSELRELLDELDIRGLDPSHPFEADEQIQPCSIDLRLCCVFWRPKKGAVIDLRKSHLLELQPRRYYQKVILKPGESIVVKPGQLVLGRIYERFRIPREFAGDIIGRSSFARMGLQVHCTGSFINPGWEGHMPLQILNTSPTPIRLVPYVPICQIRLVKLTSIPARLYGKQELQSKYMADDGGPSYWWRDKRIRQLHSALGKVDVSLGVQQDILKIVGKQEPEVIERLENHVDKMMVSELENASSALERFAKSEDRRRLLRRIAISSLRAIFPLLLATSLGSLFARPFTYWHYSLWAATVLSIPISFMGLQRQVGDHLGRPELRKLLHMNTDVEHH